MERRKPRVPESANDKRQSERFIEAARDHETDETGTILERVFKKLAPRKKPLKKGQEP